MMGSEHFTGPNIVKPQYQFADYKNMGLTEKQKARIQSLVSEYMTKYSRIQLKIVCDFYSWDHSERQVTEFNYLHDRDRVLYKERKELARHNRDDYLIGFNHIRMSNIKVNCKSDVRKILYQKKCWERKNKILSMNDEQFQLLLSSYHLKKLRSHGVRFPVMTLDRMDVVWIRKLEETKSVERICIHEIGHAISQGYKLDECKEIRELYQKYRLGFEDIEEFIAECFMASELTEQIQLANRVKEIINNVKNCNGSE